MKGWYEKNLAANHSITLYYITLHGIIFDQLLLLLIWKCIDIFIDIDIDIFTHFSLYSMLLMLILIPYYIVKNSLFAAIPQNTKQTYTHMNCNICFVPRCAVHLIHCMAQSFAFYWKLIKFSQNKFKLFLLNWKKKYFYEDKTYR